MAQKTTRWKLKLKDLIWRTECCWADQLKHNPSVTSMNGNQWESLMSRSFCPDVEGYGYEEEETLVSRLHKSRSPTSPSRAASSHLCLISSFPWLFAPDCLKKLFFGFFSQADVRRIGIGWPLGELVQYAFNRLSSSSLRPHPDLRHGQAFFFGVKKFQNYFPRGFNPYGRHIHYPDCQAFH